MTYLLWIQTDLLQLQVKFRKTVVPKHCTYKLIFLNLGGLILEIQGEKFFFHNLGANFHFHTKIHKNIKKLCVNFKFNIVLEFFYSLFISYIGRFKYIF